MLDQENQGSTDDKQAPQQESEQQPRQQSNNQSDSQNHVATNTNTPSLLSEHDYCSPNKGLTSRQQQTQKNSTMFDLNASQQRTISHQTAPKRPRQNTSVTDKSQWITGEEQLDSALSEHLEEFKEKRQRKETHDPDFSRFTSSECSSSDAESDQNSDCDSEDDPNRLWCVCNKPHGGKFMISCDICKYWYHGHCVGVTAAMSARYDRENKEWFCPECQTLLQNGTLRDAIPLKLAKKEKKKSISKPTPTSGKRGRGRPRKSEQIQREVTTRLSQRNTRKSSSSMDCKVGTRKNPNKPDARSESFEEFENEARLKELIKERKKEFFYKRSLAEQQKAQKMRELGLGGRHSVTTASLSDGLDSLASSTNTPNMNNLPINIKSEHRERSKPNIVLQINTKKDPGVDHDNQRIVTTIVKSKKRRHLDSNDLVADELFTAEPIKISKKTRVEAETSTSAQSQSKNTGESTTSPTNDRKNAPSNTTLKQEKSSTPDLGEYQVTTPKKKRKDSESSNAAGSSTPVGAKHIAQKIKENLECRSKQVKDIQVSVDHIEKLSIEIESQLNECFKGGSPKYLNKYRSLVFNLRDTKNEALIKNVLSGEISPARLVRMSPDEMASNELAKWRERENKHAIELIKRDAQLAAQQVIVKKTHKGEEVISAPTPSEPENPSTTVVDEVQDQPTTPSKLIVNETKSEVPQRASNSSSNDAAESKLCAAAPEISSSKQETDLLPSKSNLPIPDSQTSESTTANDPTGHVDIDHSTDANQETNSRDTTSVETGPKGLQESPEPQLNQPKRFRVSIDTKLDPTNLSRLKEPLIKPSENQNIDSVVYSPSGTSPASQINSQDMMDEEEDDIYDPELNSSTNSKSLALASPKIFDPNEPCWTGTVTMPDVGKFSAAMKQVSGDVGFMKEEINENLFICGRIRPHLVSSYIRRLKTVPKNQILLVQIHPLTESDRSTFEALFDYLYTRARYGVINNNVASSQVLKDFYVLPIHENGNIPEIMKPINGPGLDRKHPNCLLGVLVRCQRTPSSALSSATYTPTRIK